MKFSAFKNQKGFSLVELMIVVGIIGILATLALPRFKQFQAKAKMGEAKNILSHIYTLQQTYSLDNNTFVQITQNMGAAPGSLTGNENCQDATIPAGAQAIGFRLDPCLPNAPVPRYGYSVQTATAAAFIASAVTGNMEFNRVCPGNNTHHYAINEGNVIWGGTGGAPASLPATPQEPNVGAVCGK
ncbi:type IV pilin protein [Oligoflexus tunisiensis]|uniref:type IV pilin protein n=1 Tax=Oligoflexus tunisiensis TaxID=708132 RepID=UPI00114CE837|nr:type II secretion system protein [Oligoflexus tunisiensis]